MTTFPALTPSSRVFTPGEYPATAFNGYSGAQNRVRHSNVFLASQLRLTFKAASEADMLTIWRHYAGTQGNYESFELSPEALSDVSSTDYVPGVYRWIYAGPGSVEDLPCGGHNISLTLETVPPVAASVVGSRLRIALALATGGAVSTDTSGIAGVIELGLMAGDAFEAQNGLSESIELGLTTGEAFGGITGLHESIELVLDAGAAASTSGISGVLNLALTTGPGSVASAPGIDEAIDLVLVGGAAEEVVPSAPTDPDFASVSLLLHMDGSNGSTTFTDSSSNGFAVSVFGDAQITTTDPKFGTGALTLDGNGDYLTLPANAAFQFGTGDFTVEFFVYRTSTALDQGIFTFGAANALSGLFAAMDNANLEVGVLGGDPPQISGGTLSLNTWHHVAITRSGTNLRAFIDGVQFGSTVTNSTNLTDDQLKIGYSFNTTFVMTGKLDEFRVTKGVARYTANFTPPTAPFPDS